MTQAAERPEAPPGEGGRAGSGGRSVPARAGLAEGLPRCAPGAGPGWSGPRLVSLEHPREPRCPHPEGLPPLPRFGLGSEPAPALLLVFSVVVLFLFFSLSLVILLSPSSLPSQRASQNPVLKTPFVTAGRA